MTSREKFVAINWPDFLEERDDYHTIGHIYPQNAKHEYWKLHFNSWSSRQNSALCNSLGNLVPLSKPKNSSLSNRSFPEKRDGRNSAISFQFGSYAEIEISKMKDWTPKSILERGLRLLEFMETRWQIDLGDRSQKIKILGLTFMDKLDSEVQTKS